MHSSRLGPELRHPLRAAAHPARRRLGPTECFRLATADVADTTQIHTHMCYAEFADILDAIAALDADVISVASNSYNNTYDAR